MIQERLEGWWEAGLILLERPFNIILGLVAGWCFAQIDYNYLGFLGLILILSMVHSTSEKLALLMLLASLLGLGLALFEVASMEGFRWDLGAHTWFKALGGGIGMEVAFVYLKDMSGEGEDMDFFSFFGDDDDGD